MLTKLSRPLWFVFHCLLTLASSQLMAETSDSTKVLIKTNYGQIEVTLFDKKAPETVKNFLAYTQQGYYNNTIFHRVIPNFMIQGGGFTQDLTQKATAAPIRNEAGNGMHNSRGTLAMARTNDPNSATSQFFINTVDNFFLDQNASSFGYAVFGKVINGMDVVDKISQVSTTYAQGMQDVPSQPVIMESVEVISAQ